MNDSSIQAEAIEREKALLRGQNIDRAMDHAAQLYQQASSHDPYAMHKAVESLPASVLALLLQQKLDTDLCSPPNRIKCHKGFSPIKAVRVNLSMAMALDKAVINSAKKISEVLKSNLDIDKDIESFVNTYFHRLGDIDPNKTDFGFIRWLFEAWYGDKTMSHLYYKRGSGATTVVTCWISWMQKHCKVLVVDQSDGKHWRDLGADHRHFTESIRGLRPDFVIVENHSFPQHNDIREQHFLRFIERLPFKGIWLRSYE